MGKGLIRKREVSFFAYLAMVVMMVGMALAPVVMDLMVSNQFAERGIHSGIFSYIDKAYLFFLGATIIGGIYFLIREIRHRLNK